MIKFTQGIKQLFSTVTSNSPDCRAELWGCSFGCLLLLAPAQAVEFLRQKSLTFLLLPERHLVGAVRHRDHPLVQGGADSLSISPALSAQGCPLLGLEGTQGLPEEKLDTGELVNPVSRAGLQIPAPVSSYPRQSWVLPSQPGAQRAHGSACTALPAPLPWAQCRGAVGAQSCRGELSPSGTEPAGQQQHPGKFLSVPEIFHPEWRVLHTQCPELPPVLGTKAAGRGGEKGEIAQHCSGGHTGTSDGPWECPLIREICREGTPATDPMALEAKALLGGAGDQGLVLGKKSAVQG